MIALVRDTKNDLLAPFLMARGRPFSARLFSS